MIEKKVKKLFWRALTYQYCNSCGSLLNKKTKGFYCIKCKCDLYQEIESK